MPGIKERATTNSTYVRAGNEVVAVPVLLQGVRGPVGGIRSHHRVVGDRVACRVLLRRRQAAGACRGHDVAGGGRLNGSRDAAVYDLFDGVVLGTGKNRDPRQGRGCEQKDSGELGEEGHLAVVEVESMGRWWLGGSMSVGLRRGRGGLWRWLACFQVGKES